MFADGTNVFIQGNDVCEIELSLNRELIKLEERIKTNRLSLNAKQQQQKNRTFHVFL